jgi:hypothetical protein
MNARLGLRPRMSFSLPPGFFPDAFPSGAQAEDDLLGQLTDGLGEAATAAVTTAFDVARAQARFQAAHDSGLSFYASGLHPRDDGGVDLSKLSAGVVPVRPGEREQLLLATVKAEQDQPGTEKVGVLATGSGDVVIAERLMVVQTPEPSGEVEVTLYGVRASIPTEDGRHLAIIDLTTKSVDQRESYRAVLVDLVLPSMTFTDPPPAPPPPQDPERVRRFAEQLGTVHTRRPDTNGAGS